MKKRLLAMLMALALLLTMLPAAALADDSANPGSDAAETTDAGSPFVDVQNSSEYYYTPVLWAVGQGVTAGTDSTHFSPNAKCTRGQVVTFLYRAAGSPAVSSTSNPFSDVKKTDYFYNAVLWAVSKNITNGTDSTHFSPNATCTRGQVVTFLKRAAGTPYSIYGNPYDDVTENDYFYLPVLWATASGITNGTDATHFSPNATCTRGQVVTFLYRCYVSPEYVCTHNHLLSESENVVEATCTTGGSYDRFTRCTDCGRILSRETRTTPAKGHTVVTDAAVAGTCVQTGLTEGSHCSVCGAVLVAQTTTPKGGHTVVTDAAVAPTCTRNGKTEGSHCSSCGTVFVAQEEIPCLPHTPVTDAAVAPTCTTNGKTEGSHCSVCKSIIQAPTTIPATGHSYDDGVVTTQPTCTTAGVRTYTCSVCGAEKTASISATGHSYTFSIIYPTPTCPGSVTYTCTICGYSNTVEAVLTEDQKLTVAGTLYYIGEDVSELGTPDEILPSTSYYGFEWYVYGTATYKNFFAAGVLDGRVVALASAGPGFTYQGMQCGDQLGSYTSGSDCDVEIFTDKNDNNIVHAVLINAYPGLSDFSEENLAGESKLNFHMTNAFRVYHGKTILKWETKAESIAILHSQDMAAYNYFSHSSRSEDTRYSSTKYSARFTAAGISWSGCGENITTGWAQAYGSGIQAYNSWVNSSDHRTNMLRDYWTYLGVGGGCRASSSSTFFTQDFWY